MEVDMVIMSKPNKIMVKENKWIPYLTNRVTVYVTTERKLRSLMIYRKYNKSIYAAKCHRIR